MPAVDPVILQLRAEMRQYQNQLRSTTVLVESSLNRQEKAVQRLEFEYQRTGGNISGSLRAIGSAAAALATLQTARQLLSIADSAKQIEAQLRLATAQTGSFGQAQDDVTRIASQTRTALAETANLYGVFQRSAMELGITQEQAARATETVTKAFRVSGSSAAATAGALTQFVQGIQSGTLRGEELNSVLEQAPRLARLIADGMGVTIGQLRKLGEEGKITGDQLIRVLTNQRYTSGLDNEFRQLPVTFDEAMTQVQNAAIITFGAFDRGGQFSTALATFISDGSAGFESLASDAQRAGADIRAAFETLSDMFDPIIVAGRSAWEQIGADGRSVAQQIRDDFVGILRLTDRINEFGANNLGTARTNYAGSFNERSNAERIRTANVRIGNAVIRSLSRQQDDNRPTRSPASTVSDADRKKAESARKKAERKATAAAKRAESARLREIRDDAAFANEKQALNQDLLRARAAMATAADTIATFEVQEIEAQRQRQADSYAADVKLGRLNQTQADELTKLNDQIAQARKDKVERDRRERERADRLALDSADLDTQRDLAAIDSDLATTNDQRRQAAHRLLDLELKQERLRLEAIKASETATEAEKEIARRRLAVLPTIAAGQRAGVDRQFEGPMTRYRRELEDIDTVLENVQVDGLRALNRELADGVKNALGLKGALGDVVSQLIDIGIQRTVIGPIANQLFGAATGGSGGALGGLLGGIFGRASGGYVPPNGVVRVNEGRSSGVELLRMGSQGGQVIPLGQADQVARRPQSTTVISAPQFDMRGAMVDKDVFAEMRRIADDSSSRAGREAYNRAMKDAPNAVASSRRFN